MYFLWVSVTYMWSSSQRVNVWNYAYCWVTATPRLTLLVLELSFTLVVFFSPQEKYTLETCVTHTRKWQFGNKKSKTSLSQIYFCQTFYFASQTWGSKTLTKVQANRNCATSLPAWCGGMATMTRLHLNSWPVAVCTFTNFSPWKNKRYSNYKEACLSYTLLSFPPYPTFPWTKHENIDRQQK